MFSIMVFPKKLSCLANFWQAPACWRAKWSDTHYVGWYVMVCHIAYQPSEHKNALMTLVYITNAIIMPPLHIKNAIISHLSYITYRQIDEVLLWSGIKMATKNIFIYVVVVFSSKCLIFSSIQTFLHPNLAFYKKISKPM